ncbi:hypothetical protein [Butyrivibrio proteoclasticus]|uniref:hypothetical protein n=1 Tax=Butyrivibrio proteoclasticus TaxID=43305 RepID=UPI00047BADF0|nr:hypothetical protein [Butyrivibrio proteoclasticus]
MYFFMIILALLGVLFYSKLYPQYKDKMITAYGLVCPYMYGVGKIGCAFSGCCGGGAKILLDFLRDTHGEQIISVNQIICIGVMIALFTLRRIFGFGVKADEI